MTDKSSYVPGEPTWIDLGTPDLAATTAFYTELFGWTAGPASEEFGGYAQFTQGGKAVAGVYPLMSPEQPAVWTTYISVADADKTASLVAENGGMTHAAPMDVGDLGRMAVFADPAGAAFGVWQPRAMTGTERVEVEGTYTWTELATRDQAGALPFYRAVFDWEADVDPDYTQFKLPGGHALAGCRDLPAEVPAEVPSSWMPYFAADDPAAAAQRAATLGATVVVPFVEMDDVSFSVVRDPNGSPFGLLKLST